MKIAKDASTATGKIDPKSGIIHPDNDRISTLFGMLRPYINEDSVVFDSGCGTGWLGDLVSNYIRCSYWGFDTWKEQIEINRDRYEQGVNWWAFFFVMQSDDGMDKLLEKPTVIIPTVFVEFGMNTAYGIESKDRAHELFISFAQQGAVVALETPMFFGLVRYDRIKQMYVDAGFTLEVEETKTFNPEYVYRSERRYCLMIKK